MRVRIAQPVRPRRVVRRIRHRQHDVRLIDELLPLLPDPHVGGVGGGEAEDVDRHRHLPRRVAAAQVAELLADHPRAHASLGEREVGLADQARLVGKAHVVELHFAEAERDRFVADVAGVRPDLAMVRIEPGASVLVEPRRAVALPLHRPLRLRLREQRVLRHHDPRDREDVVRAHRVDDRAQALRASSAGWCRRRSRCASGTPER